MLKSSTSSNIIAWVRSAGGRLSSCFRKRQGSRRDHLNPSTSHKNSCTVSAESVHRHEKLDQVAGLRVDARTRFGKQSAGGTLKSFPLAKCRGDVSEDHAEVEVEGSLKEKADDLGLWCGRKGAQRLAVGVVKPQHAPSGFVLEVPNTRHRFLAPHHAAAKNPASI